MEYQEILKRANINDENVVCVYPYGSRVYGTFNMRSDYDFIFVVKNKINDQFSDNYININFYTVDEHRKRIEDHEISALECQFLTSGILKENMKFPFKLDVAKLRHSLSAKSSNSWVKCKKKLTVVVDYDLSIGRKSMFHAFRIIDFGIQIAKTGKINDYSSSNELHKEIFDEYDWEILFDKFKIRYNNLLSDFRLVTHK
jgi:hypothetical protein